MSKQPTIKKIEIDEDGNIFHVYTIKGDHDPHNPDGGLEIDNAHAALHEDMMKFLGDYREMYIYDEIKGLRKRKESECKSELVGNLQHFEELPQGFVKKNLGKTNRNKI